MIFKIYPLHGTVHGTYMLKYNSKCLQEFIGTLEIDGWIDGLIDLWIDLNVTE